MFGDVSFFICKLHIMNMHWCLILRNKGYGFEDWQYPWVLDSNPVVIGGFQLSWAEDFSLFSWLFLSLEALYAVTFLMPSYFAYISMHSFFFLVPCAIWCLCAGNHVHLYAAIQIEIGKFSRFNSLGECHCALSGIDPWTFSDPGVIQCYWSYKWMQWRKCLSLYFHDEHLFLVC